MAKANVRPTADMVRAILSYDPETGVFATTRGRQGLKAGSPKVGTIKPDGRREVCVYGTRHYAHRLAWLMMTGEWPQGVIDHINGDPADNRWRNLRDVDHATNSQNQRQAQKSNKSTGALGVTARKSGKFQARISPVRGVNLYLGTFASAGEAHAAYVKAKREIHAGCTV
jgi:hypothetical protein